MTASVAVAPIARSMAWGPLAGAAVALGAIAAGVRPWDGHRLSVSVVRLALALAAVAAAFGVDDSAAVTLAPSPTSLGHRRTIRLALVAAGGIGVAAASCLSIAALGGVADLPVARLALEAVGLQAAAIAAALLLGADRGACVFAATLLGSLVIQQRFPDYALFPLGPGDPVWVRSGITWAAITVTAAATIAALCRDPATRPFGAGRRQT